MLMYIRIHLEMKMLICPTPFLFLLSIHLGYGQVISVASSPKPQAIFTSSQLPFEDFGHSLHYDGEDSILIFSANSEAVGNRAIFRFNITSEEIDRFLPIPFRGRYAPMVRLHDGTYMYIGNDQYSPRVLNFDLATNKSRIVHELPYDLPPANTFFPSSSTPDQIYLVGGTAIHEFDTSTYCLTHVKNLTGLSYSIVASGIFGEHLYIFKYEGLDKFGTTLVINRQTLEQTTLGEAEVKFYGSGGTTATSKHLYMLGGYDRGNPFPTDGILQYSPRDNAFKFIRIDGFPPGFDGAYGNPPTMIFVKKLNRIYFFGGSSSWAQPRNHIWYIDVSLME